jgi:phosphatidate cytidylyltransferase
MKRLVTGLILGVFFFWLVCFAPQKIFLMVLIGVALLCYYEFLGIVAATFPQHDNLAKTFTGYVAGVVLLLLPLPQIGVFVVLFALLAFALSLRHERLDAVLPLSACSVFGLLYVFGSWRCALELRAISPWWLLFAAGVNWIGDSVAYYVGSNFGRHKLSPHISPGKTWEGTAGSLGASCVAGVAYLHFLFPQIPAWQGVLLCAAANAAGQIGDLCESAIKRGAGVKDSSNLLPGHGGWLDRVDSSLFSIPVVYGLVQLVRFLK